MKCAECVLVMYLHETLNVCLYGSEFSKLCKS
uniref:Uncharacterized protein n=1 Tax=Arundo donax TaxID=35708 RepID=A0A0A9BX07_ARUDO